MALRIAVTGSPGSGKSTTVQKAVEISGVKASGMLSRERREGGRRIGFAIENLATGEVGTLARLSGEGPRLGRYVVDIGDLDGIGARAIEEAPSSELIVIDEVGPMELASSRFVAAVEAALDTDRPMLVVLHGRSRHPLARRIRENFRLLTITPETRDAIAREIGEELRLCLGERGAG